MYCGGALVCFEMIPNGLGVKGFASSPGYYREVVELFRVLKVLDLHLLQVKSMGKKSDYWSHALEAAIGTRPPSCLPFASYCEVSNFVARCSPLWGGASLPPKGVDPADHGLDLPKLWAKIKLLLSWFNSGICYSNKKVIHTECLTQLFYCSWFLIKEDFCFMFSHSLTDALAFGTLPVWSNDTQFMSAEPWAMLLGICRLYH